jgi:hypothetical protein
VTYIDVDGAGTYLTATKEAYLIGLISWFQLVERLRVLRLLCRPGTQVSRYCDRILRLEQLSGEEEWLHSEPQHGGTSPEETDRELGSGWGGLVTMAEGTMKTYTCSLSLAE